MNKVKYYVDKNRKVDSLEEVCLKEYPRPSLRRDSYLCLNGFYEACITKEDKIPTSFPLKVRVPFAIESEASLFNKTLSVPINNIIPLFWIRSSIKFNIILKDFKVWFKSIITLLCKMPNNI